MRAFVIAFAGGILLLQQQERLPEPGMLWLLACAAGVALFSGWRLRKSALATRRVVSTAAAIAGSALIGFVWAGMFAQARLGEALSGEFEGRDIEIVGVVAGIPQELERGTRFPFDVEQAPPGIPRRISLAWYHARNADEHSGYLQVRAGERWRLAVRLKRPHGNLNPHGFDFEAWLFERGIRATGYVRPKGEVARIDSRVWRPGYVVEMLREAIRDRFHAVLSDAPYAGILVALAIGDQQAIPPELWQMFARTGITHLMSISGLHVTMLAGLAYAFANALWRRSPRLPLHLPAQKAAAVCGFLAAFTYCLLAGFAVPAQRTLYMLGVVVVARFTARELSASRVLALALMLVLLLDPWAVLAPGFWLSFGAVAVLFYALGGRLREVHWLAGWLRAQWAVTLGMLPALLALFQQFSLVSPLANAVAIPVISLLVTPLALAGSLPGLDALLASAHWLLSGTMWLMESLATLPFAVWQQAAPAPWAVALALAGAGWMLLPRGFPARWLGVMAFLPLLTVDAVRPVPGTADVVVLDVGQGLAIHVRTAAHDLLFDAGPRFSADADSGSRIIAPYLRAMGVRRLDTLVVSHADKDHEGGVESVLAALPVAALKTSLPWEHPLSAQPVPHALCEDGDAWEWDGVRFEMLHPAGAALSRRSNDLSCVLHIVAGGRAMLLTSDIEAVSERALLTRNEGKLAAEVMTVPHHGSRTSSTPEFIAAVGARDVIFPVGYRNRFGHPREDVVARYAASGAGLHRSDRDGAVTVTLAYDGIRIRHQRKESRRYWHGDAR